MMMTKRTNPSRKMTALALPAMTALAAMTLSLPAVADVVLRIGSATVTSGENHDRKVTKSTPSAQMPRAVSTADDIVTEEKDADAVTQVSSQTEDTSETVTEELCVISIDKTSGSSGPAMAIFIDGKEYKGDLSAVNPHDIVAMQIIKNDPAYPDGKIMITTVNAADGAATVAVASEKCAEFKGGQKALMRFLADNIKYPAEAKEAGVSGRVVVSFTIEADGTVSDPQIVRGQHPALDKEALRVVRLSGGQWIPGSNGGTPVATRYTVPISFKTK